MEQEVTQENVDPTPAKAPAPEAPKDSVEAALPDHLKPAWFEPGAVIPDFMANDPNWMNNAGVQNETVHVRMGDGSYQKTMYPIHLGLWLQQGGAKIIADPESAPDTRVNSFDVQAQQRATPATVVDERQKGA